MNSIAPMVTGKMEVPRRFFQLGLLVVDGSGSMTEPENGGRTKAEATEQAIREMFTRFKQSHTAQNFAFAIINYDDTVEIRLPITEVGPTLDDTADYNPLHGHEGGTNIYAALEEAEKIASDFLRQGAVGSVPHSVVIVVMSDGRCSDPVSTQQVAERIKKNLGNVKICSVLFERLGGPPVGEDLLKKIATNPNTDYKRVSDKDTLRKFFIDSVSTVGVRADI